MDPIRPFVGRGSRLSGTPKTVLIESWIPRRETMENPDSE